MENDTKPMSTKELTQAVSVLMEREEIRVAQDRRRQRRRIRRRREETEDRTARLTNSIEVMKWCIVGITTVMVLSLMILIAVVWQLGNEAERIKDEVEKVRGEAEVIVKEIGREAEMIRDKIQNPLRSIGGAIGSQLDQKMGNILGGKE